MNIAANIRKDPIAYSLSALAFLGGLITVITYPVAITGTKAYVGAVTAFTVIAMVILAASVFFKAKGYMPIAAILFYGLAFGTFLTSRMEDFNLIQVGIGTFGNMSAYVATIVFYAISFVACLVSAVMFGTNKNE